MDAALRTFRHWFIVTCVLVSDGISARLNTVGREDSNVACTSGSSWRFKVTGEIVALIAKVSAQQEFLHHTFDLVEVSRHEVAPCLFFGGRASCCVSQLSMMSMAPPVECRVRKQKEGPRPDDPNR